MIDRISELLDKKGMDQGELESLVGLPAGRFTRWKKGTGEPTARQAASMARHLGVPLEWLVTGDDAQEEPPVPAPELSEDERAVLAVFRALRLSGDEAIRRLSGLAPDKEAEPDVRPDAKARGHLLRG